MPNRMIIYGVDGHRRFRRMCQCVAYSISHARDGRASWQDGKYPTRKE